MGRVNSTYINHDCGASSLCDATAYILTRGIPTLLPISLLAVWGLLRTRGVAWLAVLAWMSVAWLLPVAWLLTWYIQWTQSQLAHLCPMPSPGPLGFPHYLVALTYTMSVVVTTANINRLSCTSYTECQSRLSRSCGCTEGRHSKKYSFIDTHPFFFTTGNVKGFYM